MPAGGVNICYEAVDRHCADGHGEQIAFRFLARDGNRAELSYQQLATATNRFANLLRSLGVGPGDVVFGLCPRVPELYIAALGTLKARSVFSPLFSAFGPEPIASRIGIGAGKVVVTTSALYQRKIAPHRSSYPSLEYILVIGDQVPDDPGVVDVRAALSSASSDFEIEATDPEALALLHFTSGTTGKPKGAMHVHGAVLAHKVSGKLALDLHPGDVYWCTADPGWVTGTSYGIIAPLCNRVTSIIDEAEFNAERWYQTLEREKVNVWYTAPTAIRMLMKTGHEAAQDHDLSALRFLGSVGEPLNPEAVVWGQECFGRPFHDNWWQTETGAIMIANYASAPVKPGSMGRPLPGIEATILELNEDQPRVIDEPGVEGMLAIKRGWPSMMRGYLGEEERYAKCFSGEWYLSGDLAKRDQDGYFWFVGRSDDVIKSAGHLIGPFEVESALIEHEAVAEAAVIGLPHPVAGQIVKAFVSLKPGYQAGPELEKSLRAHSRKLLGPAVAPREIAIVDDLPKTRSGKIMRRLLRARELGEPEGDTSTLESSND
jgi:acetyl-CoA synthetase